MESSREGATERVRMTPDHTERDAARVDRAARSRRLFATAAKGLEPLLAAELRVLGVADVKEARAGCGFAGGLEEAYRVCLWSRLASRVLLPLADVDAADTDRLYSAVAELPWEDHLSPSGTMAVDFTGVRSPITHTRFGALRVKDAVVDRLRDIYGERPSVDLVRPDVRVNVHAREATATVSIDLSGAALHRRGYREEGVQVQAPLKENLAAAVLLRAGWPAVAAEGGGFVDPMCGSGTLPVEAALMAADVAPGLSRSHWGFLAWRGHDAASWERVLAEAHERRAAGRARVPRVTGFDSDPRAVKLALAAVERAGLRGVVHVERRTLAEISRSGRSQGGSPGLLAVNPPYGERMGEKETLGPLYAELGRTLREGFLGWGAALLTSDLGLARWTGLRAHRTYTLYNGALEVKLLLFDVRPERFAGASRTRASSVSETPDAGVSASPVGESVPRSDVVGAGASDARPPRVRGPGVEMLANRLRKNARRLRRWIRREGVTCYRLYDGDLPEYAVAIDLYEEYVHVQEYQAPSSVDPARAQARLRDVMDAVAEVLGAPSERVFFKVRRRQRGTDQYGRLSARDDLREVGEGGLRFLVDFAGRLDTGLFLDHRPTRSLIRELAAGGRFLNLFAYTGSATVYAAAGGATRTVSVDLSARYLEWAGRNLRLNGFAAGEVEQPGVGGGGGPAHRLVRADCVEWLRAGGPVRGESGGYHLVFLDPPTFSNSKRMGDVTLDVQRDHVELITKAAGLLEPSGTLLFSTNNRRFHLDAEALAGMDVEDITARTIPPDFERNPRVHSCWTVRRRREGP